MMNTLRRTIHPEVRVLSEAQGIAEYVASDETLDSCREVIRADGWRFDLFRKNAPFVDSHNYDSIEHLLGSVVDFRVSRGRLVETVQWAIDVPENTRAQLGWKMTASGHLKGVSVGFLPEADVTPGDRDFDRQLEEINWRGDVKPSRIFVRQQQLELSSVVIPANPNALVTVAKAYRAGVLTDREFRTLIGQTRADSRSAPALSPEATRARLLALCDRVDTDWQLIELDNLIAKIL